MLQAMIYDDIWGFEACERGLILAIYSTHFLTILFTVSDSVH